MAKTLLSALVAAAGAAFALPATVQATAPCLPLGPSPQCHFWYGKVTFVDDGDTLMVNIAGDHRRARRVRFTGINAMELHRYSKYRRRRRGDCHAVAAANRVEDLVRRSHRRVRLSAQHPGSHAGWRLRRSVAVKVNGAWVDLGSVLVLEGHALWLPNHKEWAWNRTYAGFAHQARAAGKRLWDPTACGGSGHPRLRMRLRYDAPHNDGHHVNGEMARITNHSARRVHLGHWWFRDSALRRFTFPRGAVIRPHASVKLRMGRGPDHRRTFHWGLTSPPFENPTYDRRWLGDGGYLFDRHGNIRAAVIYP